MSPTAIHLRQLYVEDETAWLLEMAHLITEGRHADLDFEHLAEYLADMARRDKREVVSRLTVLIAHLLKWQVQPTHRSRSWQATILEQRHQLEDLLESGVLRSFALDSLPTCHARAVELASTETGVPPHAFPATPDATLDDLLLSPLPD